MIECKYYEERVMANSLIHLLNTTTRMPFEIVFVMLIVVIVFLHSL